jgi:uncharacterized protein YbjT (DUF2867 family)
MKIKVIITGATGMVGEGVLHECLAHPDISEVLLLTRKSTGIEHAKVKELVHPDLMHAEALRGRLRGYNACFFCLGVTSIGKKEDEYNRLTYTLTLHVASILAQENPQMTFCYISGAGTDSTEKGRVMWARVKGRTENDLLKLPFKKVFLFRPGYLQPTKGLKNTHKFYNYISWMYPVLSALMPGSASTLKELGLAMINSVLKGYGKSILEVKDIKLLARQ